MIGTFGKTSSDAGTIIGKLVSKTRRQFVSDHFCADLRRIIDLSTRASPGMFEANSASTGLQKTAPQEADFRQKRSNDRKHCLRQLADKSSETPSPYRPREGRL
jgi:hypothetical protein